MIYRIADKSAFGFVPTLDCEQVVLTDMPDNGVDVSDILARIKTPETFIYPKIVLAKLFIPFFSKEDFSLYMDLDTEIVGDITPLLEMNFSEIICAKLFSDNNNIWNSGVMVFNNRRYKENFTIDGLIYEMNNYSIDDGRNPGFLSDETIFHKIVPNVKRLETKYNIFPHEHNLVSDPVIYHHLGLLRR